MFSSLFSLPTIGLDDVYSVGAVMPNGGNPGLEGYFGFGVSHGPNFGQGLDGYIEDPLGGEESGGSIVGPTGAKKNEQGDLVTTSLSFLLVHLKIDGTAWAPFLSSGFVGSMALLQVMMMMKMTMIVWGMVMMMKMMMMIVWGMVMMMLIIIVIAMIVVVIVMMAIVTVILCGVGVAAVQC